MLLDVFDLGGWEQLLELCQRAIDDDPALVEDRDPIGELFGLVLGAIIGGILEYAVMLTGIKSLYLIGALAYLGALIALRRASRAAAAVPDARIETSAAA